MKSWEVIKHLQNSLHIERIDLLRIVHGLEDEQCKRQANKLFTVVRKIIEIEYDLNEIITKLKAEEEK